MNFKMKKLYRDILIQASTSGWQALSLFILLPFLSRMIMDFGLASSRNETGYYTGLVGAALFVSRSIAAPLWGKYADTYGRKPTMLISLAAQAVLVMLYAVAVNLWQLWAIRFVLGAFTVLSPMVRIVISEITTAETQAVGMSSLNLAWHLGVMIGCGLGGFLAYSDWFQIDNNPYLIPLCLVSVFLLANLFLLYFFFEETLQKALPNSKNTYDVQASLLQILNNRQVILILGIYFLSWFQQIAMIEIIPLWCWAERDYGGLEYSVSYIGIVMMLSAVINATAMQFLYKKISKYFGFKKTYLIGAASGVPTWILLPFLNRLIIWDEIVGFITLIAVYNLYQFADYLMNTTIFIFINNSINPRNLGKLNGLATTTSSVARIIAPLIASNTFANSIAINSSLVNHHFMFFIISATFILCVVIGTCIPKSLEESQVVHQEIQDEDEVVLINK